MPLTALYEGLGQVKDGRKKRGCRYSLALLLTLLLLVRLAGETELRGAAHWIQLRKKWIIEHLPVKRASVPCLGTFLYGKISPRCGRRANRPCSPRSTTLCSRFLDWLGVRMCPSKCASLPLFPGSLSLFCLVR